MSKERQAMDEYIDDLVEGRVPEVERILKIRDSITIPADAVVTREKGKRVIRKERRKTPRMAFCVPIRVSVMDEDEVREFENQDREILEQQPEDAIITTENGEKVLRHERRGEPRADLRGDGFQPITALDTITGTPPMVKED